MRVLIANPGSTSYKCKLYETDSMQMLFQAGVERIGDQQGSFTHQFGTEKQSFHTLPIPDYATAIDLTIKCIESRYSMSSIAAVGFKTVHAKGITGCVYIDDHVLKAMQEYMPLVPVHNHVYLTAISAFRNLLPQTPLIALFETHFHTEIPEEAYLYGIPYEYFENHGVRKYGFHGASHRYIAYAARQEYFKERDHLKIISCHLGGSSSVCAIRDGVSIDTSMGMSAQSGCLNATRVGDMDSFALLYIMEKENLSIDDMRHILITNGGLKGISGRSGDFRDIEKAMQNGDDRARKAFNTFAYHVKRYIGEYLVVLNGVDMIVFTAGAGQKSVNLREKILENTENLGIVLDQNKNRQTLDKGIISAENSGILVAVIPTNEEWILAQEVAEKISCKPCSY